MKLVSDQHVNLSNIDNRMMLEMNYNLASVELHIILGETGLGPNAEDMRGRK